MEDAARYTRFRSHEVDDIRNMLWRLSVCVLFIYYLLLLEAVSTSDDPTELTGIPKKNLPKFSRYVHSYGSFPLHLKIDPCDPSKRRNWNRVFCGQVSANTLPETQSMTGIPQ